MSSSNASRTKPVSPVPGAVVRDSFARFVFGMGPHPGSPTLPAPRNKVPFNRLPGTGLNPVPGAVVRDSFARFVFGMGPHPGSPAPQLPRKKAFFGPSLQLATAGLLGAESFAHLLPAGPQHALGQMAIGAAQRLVGFGGMAYYGRKAQKEGGFDNYVKAAGYGAFAMHGFARMMGTLLKESSLQHFMPHGLVPGTGGLAATLKGLGSGPVAMAGFAADAFEHAAHYAHGLEHPASGTWKGMLHDAFHHVKPLHMIRAQRAGAVLLTLDAAYEMIIGKRKKLT